VQVSPRLFGGFRGRKVITVSDTPNEEFDQVDDEEQPSKLRQLLKQKAAENKQLLEKLAALESAEVQRSVKATWDELKVPDVIRKLYTGDTSTDAIKAWWNDSKGLFNIQAAEETPAPPEPTPEELAQQEAAQRFQDASSLGTNAIQSGFDAIKAQVEQAKGLRGTDYEAAKAKIYEQMGTPKY
jgi:hypothetical protein